MDLPLPRFRDDDIVGASDGASELVPVLMAPAAGSSDDGHQEGLAYEGIRP